MVKVAIHLDQNRTQNKLQLDCLCGKFVDECARVNECEKTVASLCTPTPEMHHLVPSRKRVPGRIECPEVSFFVQFVMDPSV